MPFKLFTLGFIVVFLSLSVYSIDNLPSMRGYASKRFLNHLTVQAKLQVEQI